MPVAAALDLNAAQFFIRLLSQRKLAQAVG